MFWTKSLAATAAALALGATPVMGQAPAALGTVSLPLDTYAAPHQLVTVEQGRRLNLLCLGSGAPTVILDAGAGGDSKVWLRVQGRIATFTRVCSYDRAGYGYSDPANRPSNAVNAADDLDRLLRAADIAGPVVLVGHSAGGLYATLYADRHLSNVAGMVLVDPVVSHYLERRFGAQTQEDRAADLAGVQQMFAERSDCLRRAKAGEDMQKCHGLGPGSLPASVYTALVERLSLPSYYEAGLSEMHAAFDFIQGDLTVNDLAEDAEARPFGPLPMIVLTRGELDLPAFMSEESRSKVYAAWKADHERLAARSTLGKTVIVTGSGHGIHFASPDVVAEAVKDVVGAARAKSPH